MESKPKRQKTAAQKDLIVKTANDAERQLNGLKHSDPVLQLHLAEQIPDISLSTATNLLETLLYPLTPSLFQSACFRKKAVHIASNNLERAKEISKNYMFDLDPRQIFEETSSDGVFLWISNNKSNNGSDNNDENNTRRQGLQSIELQDPQTAYILHTSSQYASYCRAPPQLEQPLVSAMLRDTGIGLGQYDPAGEKLTTLGRGEVETFIGTKNHVTDWHTDFQENFTIQLSGRKRWTLKQGTVKNPLRGTTPHYCSSEDVIENQIKAARLSNPGFQFGKQDLDGNAFGKEVEIIMNAGDVLYFPAGMWHKIETLEYGVSINVSLMGSTYASLVCQTLEHILLQRDEWREVICSSKDNNNNNNGLDVVEKLKSLMKNLPGIVEEFQKAGGSEGILPPVLRRPPNFEIVNEEEGVVDGSDDDENDDEKNDSIEMNAHEYEEMNGSENMSTTENGLEGVDDNGMDIVDVEDFELPSDFNSDGPSGDSWRKNPLGSLIRVNDTRSFFGKHQESYQNCFILNINFAGNDMHESTVRVILRDRSGLLERLCALEEDEKPDEIAFEDEVPPALIYFGYVV